MVDPVPAVTQGYRATWLYSPKYEIIARDVSSSSDGEQISGFNHRIESPCERWRIRGVGRRCGSDGFG